MNRTMTLPSKSLQVGERDLQTSGLLCISWPTYPSYQKNLKRFAYSSCYHSSAGLDQEAFWDATGQGGKVRKLVSGWLHADLAVGLVPGQGGIVASCGW